MLHVSSAERGLPPPLFTENSTPRYFFKQQDLKFCIHNELMKTTIGKLFLQVKSEWGGTLSSFNLCQL